MQIQENYSLKAYNTFSIEAKARYFASFETVEGLARILKAHTQTAKYILGGGSNILITKDYDGLILKNSLKGIELIKQDDDHYYIKVASGEPWHPFVQYCVNHGYAGLENLSLIPGLAGASPMQNIGAYGVEIKDVFYELEAMQISDQSLHQFNKQDCQFGYRESIFKTSLKGQFIILSVTFKLMKRPILHLEYGAIKAELESAGVKTPSIKDVAAAVIRIRQSKLPDPMQIGNAGSFFKNPSISTEQYNQLKNEDPSLPGYPIEGYPLLTKVAAGYLIEKCGWKGFRQGDAGVHARQALVLVNYGSADGSEILELSNRIIQGVEQKYGITLEREVNII